MICTLFLIYFSLKHGDLTKKEMFAQNTYLFIFYLFIFYLFIFSPLMYNHATSSQLYYKYLQYLERLHAKYAQSAKTTELNLRNTARKTLDKNAMLALSPKPNTFVC